MLSHLDGFAEYSWRDDQEFVRLYIDVNKPEEGWTMGGGMDRHVVGSQSVGFRSTSAGFLALGPLEHTWRKHLHPYTSRHIHLT